MISKQSKLLDFWPLFFLLTSLEAAASLLVLLRIPSEGGSLSITRLALILPLLLVTIASAIAGYFSWQNKDFIDRWLNPDSKPKSYGILSTLFPLLAIGTGTGAFLLRWWDPERLFPVFERAWPLLAFIIAFSIQSTIWILVLQFGLHKTDFTARKPALIAFVILIFAFSFVGLTKLGLMPDPAYWGEPGVPIQYWQFGLALIAGASFLPFSLSPFFNSKSRRVDLLIGISIWVLTKY